MIAFSLLISSSFQIVGEGCSEDVQMSVLSLLHLATEHSVMAAIEFEQQGGMVLIQQVMRTPQAAVGDKIMNVCFILYYTYHCINSIIILCRYIVGGRLT